MACTLPRASAGRALCKGKEGLVHVSARGCLAEQTQRCTECTRLPGSLVGSAAPHTRRLTPWVPSRCLTHVASLALSSPAEMCAAGWDLPLRAGLPPTAPAQGKQPLRQDLPEAQSAPTWKPSEQLAGRRASSREKMQRSLVWLKPYLAGAECASRTAELQLCSEARSGRVAGARLLCPGRALSRLASQQGFLPRKEQAARGWETPLAPS